jgi:hypothetical protein
MMPILDGKMVVRQTQKKRLGQLVRILSYLAEYMDLMASLKGLDQQKIRWH